MPAGGDNDLTCSVLGRFFFFFFFLRDGHFTSFYVLFYKKKCCIFATENHLQTRTDAINYRI